MVLDVFGCEFLARMDNLKGLSALENLYVRSCTNLLALPDLGMSKGLTVVSLLNCPLIDLNLVKLPRRSTSGVLDLKDSADEFSDRKVKGQEGEIHTSPVIDSQKPEACFGGWRSARALLPLPSRQ